MISHLIYHRQLTKNVEAFFFVKNILYGQCMSTPDFESHCLNIYSNDTKCSRPPFGCKERHSNASMYICIQKARQQFSYSISQCGSKSTPKDLKPRWISRSLQHALQAFSKHLLNPQHPAPNLPLNFFIVVLQCFANARQHLRQQA